MELPKKTKLFAYLPIIAIFCYWLYACVVSAFISGDPRLLKISFVSLPLIAAIALSALKLRRQSDAAR